MGNSLSRFANWDGLLTHLVCFWFCGSFFVFREKDPITRVFSHRLGQSGTYRACPPLTLLASPRVSPSRSLTFNPKPINPYLQMALLEGKVIQTRAQILHMLEGETACALTNLAGKFARG